MRFVIDESSWVFDPLSSQDCADALEMVLDCIDHAAKDGHFCCYSDELFNKNVCDDYTFYDLYNDNSPIVIAPEVRERMAVIFSHLPVWQELDDAWPESLDVRISEGPIEYAPSVAWAHAQTISNKRNPVACIVYGSNRKSGPLTVVVVSNEALLWFVALPGHFESYFRWLIEETTTSPEEMEALAKSAFRNLEFIPGIFQGIKQMSKPYKAISRAIVKHLAILSDNGERIFRGPRERVSAEFGSLGIEISDENGNTKSNQKARRARIRIVEAEVRIFWWHTKLEPHQDRIHICPEKLREGGRILVGIFCRHLTV